MTLEERLQGEWLCCVDDQSLDEAWLIDIRGRQCDFEGTGGTLIFSGDEAVLTLGGGDRFVINRRWLLPAPGERDRGDELPVVIESDNGTLQSGWMFRPGTMSEGPVGEMQGERPSVMMKKRQVF